MDNKIDRTSYIPFYAQVQDALKEYIEHGEVKPGEQLPSEPELCRMFDVSRTVIRQALRGLEYEGLIVREKGRGTFVAEPKIGESLFQELTGFYQDMASKGLAPVSKVLKQAVIPANAKIAAFLQLPPETPVIRIDRVRYVEGEPIVLVTTYLPHALCPALVEADLTDQSLYAYLEETYNLVIDRGRRILEAVVASEYEAALLEIPEGAPLISLDSISYLESGTPLEYYHALHRGDRSMFEVELIRTREPINGAKSLLEESHEQLANTKEYKKES
ncbi:MAG: GntR family transcriptional regulator [Ardenticatenaceae bacterium]|nr:GntR family transcriptional regulator [Ardenticatenaceae bacterium]MCB8986489.1 GntR family transcriptional regulator [Ardenticatenaceae bacterium]